MSYANLDLGVFQETKVSYGIHTSALAGYCVFVGKCEPAPQGVAVFYQDAPHFQVKALKPHGPNVLIFQVELV